MSNKTIKNHSDDCCGCGNQVANIGEVSAPAKPDEKANPESRKTEQHPSNQK